MNDTYVSFMDYFLQKAQPQRRFEVYPLGLSSETLSGLSEPGHAGGKSPNSKGSRNTGASLSTVSVDMSVGNSAPINGHARFGEGCARLAQKICIHPKH